MDQVLDLMAKVVALNYDVNQLMQDVEADEKINAYQKIFDIITKPSFSFEGNEHYKKDIITLKDEYSRCVGQQLFIMKIC